MSHEDRPSSALTDYWLRVHKKIPKNIPPQIIVFEKNSKENFDVISGARKKNIVGNMIIGIASG